MYTRNIITNSQFLNSLRMLIEIFMFYGVVYLRSLSVTGAMKTLPFLRLILSSCFMGCFDLSTDMRKG